MLADVASNDDDGGDGDEDVVPRLGLPNWLSG